MSYCPNCGSEHNEGDRFCTECGEELGKTSAETSESIDDDTSSETEDDSWNWLDPKGPFRSPRTALNYFNGIGLLIIIVAVILTVAGYDEPYAVLPQPLVNIIIFYVIAVIFIGLPIAGILIITDNVLGYLRHG